MEENCSKQQLKMMERSINFCFALASCLLETFGYDIESWKFRSFILTHFMDVVEVKGNFRFIFFRKLARQISLEPYQFKMWLFNWVTIVVWILWSKKMCGSYVVNKKWILHLVSDLIQAYLLPKIIHCGMQLVKHIALCKRTFTFSA